MSPSPSGRGVGVRGRCVTALKIASTTASACINTSLFQKRSTVKALGFKTLGTKTIVLLIVLRTIHLDDQLGRGAVEVDDVRWHGMLPAEPEASQLARTRASPQLVFRISRFAPKFACLIASDGT